MFRRRSQESIITRSSLLERVKKPRLQSANPTSLMVDRSFNHGCKPLI